MAINKKLIHFKSKANFEERLANGEILDTSIVFIQDTKEIYTHGTLYNCSGTGENIDLSEYLTTEDLEEINTAISDLQTTVDTKAASSDLDNYVETTTFTNTIAGYVPTSRKVNNKPLSSDITITASDLGAATKTELTNTQTALNSSIESVNSQATANKTAIETLNGTGTGSVSATATEKANAAYNNAVSYVDGKVSDLQEQITSNDDDITAINNKFNSYATTSSLDAVSSRVTTVEGVLSTTSDTDTVINKWGDVVTFLADISDESTLEGLLGAKANQTELNETNTTLNSHISNTSNPHKVTASQLGLATVATSGKYSDLTGTPTIPTLASLMGSSALGSTSSYLYWNGSAWATKALGSNAFTNTSIPSTYVKTFNGNSGALTSAYSANITTTTSGYYTIGKLTIAGKEYTLYGKDTNTTYSFSNNAPTLAWGTTSTIGTVGGTALTVTMPANPNTHYTTGISVGNNDGTVSAVTYDPYITIKDDNMHRGQIQIKGSGATTVSSDANGVITISSTDNDTIYGGATTSAAGLMTASDKRKLDGIASGATAVTSSTVSGWGYTKNSGTVTSVATGTGLTGGTITSSGTIGLNLNSTTSLGTLGTTSKLYAVGIDGSGTLCVKVPWTDTTSSGTVTSIATGTGLTGGTITDSGTISISSTYQTYINNGNTAYGWGNHADAGYTNNTGTVRSVTISAGDGISVSSSSAIVTTGTRTISLNTAADSTLGGIMLGYSASGSNIPVQLSNSKAYVALTSSAITSALGYTPPTSDTTYSAGTGLSKSGTTFSLKVAGSDNIGGIATWDCTKANTSGVGSVSPSGNFALVTPTAANIYAGTRNYPVITDSTGVAFVNVPWSSGSSYTAGTGISISSSTINHSNSITAGTIGVNNSALQNSGALISIPSFNYDAQGHISSVGLGCTYQITAIGITGNNDDSFFPITFADSLNTSTSSTVVKTLHTDTSSSLGVFYNPYKYTLFFGQSSSYGNYNTNIHGEGATLYYHAPTTHTFTLGTSSATSELILTASYLYPTTSGGLDLGQSSYRFRYGYFTNNVYSATGFYESSDERLKDFGDDISIDLDSIRNLTKKYFTWKSDEKKKNQLGVSAQEIQKLYPEIVGTTEDGYLNVAYDKLSVIALKAFDKLYDKYNELESRINNLENK